jgi:hypothetical protein
MPHPKDHSRTRLITRIAVNTRWQNRQPNDRRAQEIADDRRALNAIKAAKLMEQAHALLHPDNDKASA